MTSVGTVQLASPVEEGTRTRTICWNYPLCTPAQLWMCEMVISASAPPFVMLARLNRHMLVWVSLGRRWNGRAGKNRPSLCLSFFSTKQAERLVSTRGVLLWYVLIFSRLTTSNVSNLFYRSTAREGCIKRRMGMVVCGNMQRLGQYVWKRVSFFGASLA